tara:strand:+ start:263 stop:805 length:543 start_codon:yes stop_codon:yes gene_type:complete
MNYQNFNSGLSTIRIEKKHFLSISSLYLFSLGTSLLGYSVYLLFESIGLIEQTIITWSAQGLFWFLILFCTALFILFIPVEFLNTYKIFNSTFKDLILNIVFIIFTSLLFLIVFQFFLTPSNNIISDIIDIGKAISFSGFIALPLLLFLQHNLIRTINLSDNLSFNVCLIVWIISSQIFL